MIGNKETQEESLQTIESLRPTLEALRKIPVDTRAIFAILLDRSEPQGSVAVPLHELELATSTAPQELAQHVQILERYGLAWQDEIWPDDRPIYWALEASEVNGWDFWRAFRDYCLAEGRPVKEVVNELRFDTLDQ